MSNSLKKIHHDRYRVEDIQHINSYGKIVQKKKKFK